jgi:hypothetical protein
MKKFNYDLQALLFYVPRKIWKSFEGGLMETFGKKHNFSWSNKGLN